MAKTAGPTPGLTLRRSLDEIADEQSDLMDKFRDELLEAVNG